MTTPGAQTAKLYRADQKQKRAEGDPVAIERWERKKLYDRQAYQVADKDKVNKQARARHARRHANDPLYRQRKIDEATKYYWLNREAVLEKKKSWRGNSVTQRAAYMAQWERANPDKRKAITLKRQYSMNETMVEPVGRANVWTRDLGLCGICTRPADTDDWHLDHIIPLSKGGSHTYDNVQVSHPLCNIRKGNSLSGSP